MSSQNKNFTSQELSLYDIPLFIAKYIQILIIIPFLFSVFTAVYSYYFMKPSFLSTSKIISSQKKSGLGQAAGIAAQFGISLPESSSEPTWPYPDIIMSRTLAKKVLKRKFNTNEFGLQKSLTQILTHGNQPPEFSDDTLEYIAANIIKQMIFVSENSKTGIITINVYANEPKLSASINNAIITELDQHQKNYDKEKTVSTKRFIQDRISKTKIELESAEENLKVFALNGIEG